MLAPIVNKDAGLDAERCEAEFLLARDLLESWLKRRARVVVRELNARAAHHLDVLRGPSRIGKQSLEVRDVLGLDAAHGVEAGTLGDQPIDHRATGPLTTEPHCRSLAPERLGLEVDVLETEEVPMECDGARLPDCAEDG